MDSVVRSTDVAISTGQDGYPLDAPYSPGVSYPEYPFASEAVGDEANCAYDGVREALRLLQLDAEHFGQEDWNPLGQLVRPGQTVVLKPNFVRDFRETHAGHEDCLITHGAVIRAALDYVYIALEGKGRIIVADAPQNDADFNGIRKIAQLDAIQGFYQEHAELEVEVYDLRPERARKVDGVIVGHESLPGDPAGYVKVALNEYSAFCEIGHLCHLLYGAEYDTSELRSHHHGKVHEYLVSKTILDADCVINLPKLKTHKKTGITVCMKNLVGINGNKNWLPHHREGTPAQGGDQYADDGVMHRIERRAMTCFRGLFPLLGPLRRIVAQPVKSLGKRVFGDTNTDAIRSGNWYGNDTTWRMAIDLNRILMYADAEGWLHERPVRGVFCIVDGIIGGEGNGPLDPTAKSTGTVIAGTNPVAVDLVCARLAGYDHCRLPLLQQAHADHPLPLTACQPEDVVCRSPQVSLDRPLSEFQGRCFDFRPHFGWRGHIEVGRER
ncbi:MAG: DUF362 domain-containing protein [Phycisphaerales bacterium]|nr:MAG: DUF362 domain-containing protein [Phycisphaerales bacterium]